nr:hypothetical protein [Okeania sp. SIO2F4]
MFETLNFLPKLTREKWYDSTSIYIDIYRSRSEEKFLNYQV